MVIKQSVNYIRIINITLVILHTDFLMILNSFKQANNLPYSPKSIKIYNKNLNVLNKFKIYLYTSNTVNKLNEK